MPRTPSQATEIRQQVLRAIALNREPGYHFCGNFLDMVLHHDHNGHSTVGVACAAGLTETDGTLSPIALCVAADFTLANAVRSTSDPSARLATVSLHLQFNGKPFKGDLYGEGELDSFFYEGQGKLGLSHAQIKTGGEVVAFGTSTFMVLPAPPGKTLHPIAWINHPAPSVELPGLEDLNEQERWIVERAEQALQDTADGQRDFLSAFFQMQTHPTEQGATATLQNGPHVGNRVGHVQGGVTMGLALRAANAALPTGWHPTGMSASFVSPGEGDELTAHATVVHKGRLTAVVHVRVFAIDGRIALETITNHTRTQSTLT